MLRDKCVRTDRCYILRTVLIRSFCLHFRDRAGYEQMLKIRLTDALDYV
jgi:hypothetical protein